MTDKHPYWIADVEGVKAVVEGAEARDMWTKVRGWTETTEPVGQEFQWIRNADHGGRGVMNHAAALLHEGLGWFPSDPPEPVDMTKDPQLVDQPPAVEPAPQAPKSTKPTANATSGDKKE
jgi:hypothetical protein